MRGRRGTKTIEQVTHATVTAAVAVTAATVAAAVVVDH
jgi:hypothetical protein